MGHLKLHAFLIKPFYTVFMKPLILHMPDALRDRLESDLCAAMPDMPDKINYADNDRIKAVIEKHLFDLGQDDESTKFLEQFYQAYLGMHTGAGNPLVLLENLPPTRGRLIMYGLGVLEGSINFGDKKNVNNKDDSAVYPHRDTVHYPHILENQKLGQYLYCEDAGSNPQPTVFITADDIINHMARQNKDEEYETARSDIIEKLKNMLVKTVHGYLPFLSCNPSYDPNHPNQAPEFLAFTEDRRLRDMDSINPPELRSLYLSFAEAAEELAEIETPLAIASTKSHSLAMWNDLLTFHMRGKTRDGLDESDRQVEIFETQVEHTNELTDSHPTPTDIAVSAPCSKVYLEELSRNSSVNAKARSPTPVRQ